MELQREGGVSGGTKRGGVSEATVQRGEGSYGNDIVHMVTSHPIAVIVTSTGVAIPVGKTFPSSGM